MGVVIAYVIFFALLPWVLLCIFPPFWFALSSRLTKNMGCVITSAFIIGMMAGIGFVMEFLFHPENYQEYLRHLPFSAKVISLIYLISITGLFSIVWEYVKQNLLFYPSVILGLIVSTICASYSFKGNDWIYFFVFCFYIAICIDFLISIIFHEFVRRKFKEIINDSKIRLLLSEE